MKSSIVAEYPPNIVNVVQPPGTVTSFIADKFDSFSRSQRDVARFIVDHLEETAFLTAEELAKKVSTSSSTVVRFSQSLGFEGYPELQHAIREEYRNTAGEGASITNQDPLFPIPHREGGSILLGDYENIEKTARKMAQSKLEEAIKAIACAERVIIVGTDQMAFFASYLRHLLSLLDVRAELVASPSQVGLAKLSRIDSKTLVVAMSGGRSHPLVTRAVKLGVRRNASTLAICDATLADIAPLAHISLFYSSGSPSFVRSHTALLSVIQAIVFGVYSRDSDHYRERVKAYRLK